MDNLRSQTLSKKCSSHPLLNCDFLLLDPTADKHLVCFRCLKEKQESEKVISIAELLTNNQSSILLFPLTEISNLKEILSTESVLKQISTDAEVFYSKLQDNIQAAFKKLTSLDFEKMKKYKEEWEESCIILKDMLSARTFQEIILSQGQDQEKKLHEYIVKRNEQIESQIQQVNANYLKIQNVMSSFSLEQPQKIETLIIKQIQQINVFGKQEPIQISSEEEIKELRIKISQFENKISDLKKETHLEITSLQKEVESEKLKTQVCNEEKEQLCKDNEAQSDRIKALQKEVESEQQKAQAFKSDNEQQSNIITALQQENNLEKQKNKMLESNWKSCREEINNLKRDDAIKQNQILSTIQCLPSKFQKSDENVQIQTILNQIQIKNISSKESSGSGQCYFLPGLKKNRNYIISLTLNNQCNESANFYIGLLPSNDKDDKINGLGRHYCFCNFGDCDNCRDGDRYCNAYYNESGSDTTKIVKGTELHSNMAKRIGIKKLEVRINLEEKVFKISSPPTYLNIVQVIPENINDIPYLFAIDVSNSGDYVTIESMLEVESFNSQM